ncbi:Contactin-Associated Protein-Like 5 [Manis pentadactyla]|nr:Contactin-Associated Protein-Like 5 [Manis pentadactyla]
MGPGARPASVLALLLSGLWHLALVATSSSVCSPVLSSPDAAAAFVSLPFYSRLTHVLAVAGPDGCENSVPVPSAGLLSVLCGGHRFGGGPCRPFGALLPE